MPTPASQPEIITVTADTVEKHGFFCKMSARKTDAWKAKRAWLEARFGEGLQLRLLGGGGRGFVEFMPGPKSWRAIDGAEDFLVIHCLWVVGQSKGKGFARALLDEVETYARANGFRGVAALTSTGNWLIVPKFFDAHGYERVDTEGDYHLLVKSFAPGPLPRLCGNWEAKGAQCGPGLTVLRSAQCPYLEDASAHARKVADQLGLAFHDEIIDTAEALRARAPTPYGTYALVKDGKLVSSHFLLGKQLLKALAA